MKEFVIEFSSPTGNWTEKFAIPERLQRNHDAAAQWACQVAMGRLQEFKHSAMRMIARGPFHFLIGPVLDVKLFAEPGEPLSAFQEAADTGS